MSTDVLRYQVSDDGVATLLLYRPEKRNALNGLLIEALRESLRRAAAEDSVSVVCIRGAGKDFCAGLDLAELIETADLPYEECLEDARRVASLMVEVRRLPKPVVALVHGRALAGGAGLATACDLVLAHEEAEFGYPEVHLGFVPGIVMSILREKVPEMSAFELAVRGHRIDAPEAARLGLVTRVLSADRFEEEGAAYLSDLASRPATALRLTKAHFAGLDGLTVEEGIMQGAEVNARARQTEAFRDGIRRFLDRSRS